MAEVTEAIGFSRTLPQLSWLVPWVPFSVVPSAFQIQGGHPVSWADLPACGDKPRICAPAFIPTVMCFPVLPLSTTAQAVSEQSFIDTQSPPYTAMWSALLSHGFGSLHCWDQGDTTTTPAFTLGPYQRKLSSACLPTLSPWLTTVTF